MKPGRDGSTLAAIGGATGLATFAVLSGIGAYFATPTVSRFMVLLRGRPRGGRR